MQRHLASGYVATFSGDRRDIIDCPRLLPAVAGAIVIVLTCLMTPQLGGGVFAILLAGPAAMIPAAAET